MAEQNKSQNQTTYISDSKEPTVPKVGIIRQQGEQNSNASEQLQIQEKTEQQSQSHRDYLKQTINNLYLNQQPPDSQPYIPNIHLNYNPQADQLKRFIKKADQINFDNYRKLKQQKRVTQFKRIQRSSGTQGEINKEGLYRQKQKNASQKENIQLSQEKQHANKFVQTSRKIFQVQTSHEQPMKTERNYRYSQIQYQMPPLNPLRNYLPVENNSNAKHNPKFNSLEQDIQQETIVPKKKLNPIKRKFSTIDNGNSAATFYLESMSKKNYQFQQQIKRYGRNSLLSEYNQEVVFKDTQNRTYSNLGLQIQKDQFKFDDKQTSVGGAPTAFEKLKARNSMTDNINKNANGFDQGRNIQIARKTSPTNFLNAKQSAPKSSQKRKEMAIFDQENRDQTMFSVYAERSSRFKKTEQSEYPNNLSGFQNNNNFNFGSNNVKKPQNNIIARQISIQVPEISQIQIGKIDQKTSKLTKLHPIGQSFQNEQISWITQQFKPKSNLITKLSLINFQIKKYKNGVYFGQLSQDGQKDGKGVIFYYNGRIYQGSFVQDMKQGKGYQCFPDGSYYNGDFKNGLKEGKGTFCWPNEQTYDGQWAKGKKNGSGMWRSPKGDSYIGQWSSGKVEGFGVFINSNGDRYEGQFINSLKHGLGTQRFETGDTYVGSYRKNRPNGEGQYFWVNGDYYKGQFCNGLRHGQGYFKEQHTKNVFKGQFQNDKFCGFGQLAYSDSGQTYIGNFENSIRHGYGELYQDGILHWKGYWINDNRVDQHGVPIIEEQLERQQSLPKNINTKKRNNAQIGKSNLNKSLSPKIKDIAKSKTPQKGSKSPIQDKNFIRVCGCDKKH